MSDISRQEKINNRIAELERQIFIKDNELDKEQGKRLKRTFFVLCGVIYFLIFYFALDSDAISINNINFEVIENVYYTIVALTFGVAFFAGLIMILSYAVMSYITNGAMRRAETMAKLKTELNTIKYFDTIYK